MSRPRWYHPEAAGQPIQGACAQEVKRELKFLDPKEHWRYAGMFDACCFCEACAELCEAFCEDAEIVQNTKQQGTGKVKIDNPDQADYMLNAGISVVTIPDSGKWLSQRYAVRHEWVQKILGWLKCPTPVVDMFADIDNRRFTRFWGRGGECRDAWQQRWEGTEMRWCNPPFTDLDFVVQKANSEGANMVLIAPQWEGRKYHTEMWHWSREHCYIKPGTYLFENTGMHVGTTRWGVWAVWIDGSLTEAERTRRRPKWMQEVQRSGASRRRYRRERREEAMVAETLEE
jgi:hypothetical protein